MSDETVRTWGSNSSGQLGDGTVNDSPVPVQVGGLTEVDAIAAGKAHTVALMKDDTVQTWGSNSSGQLGDGTVNDSPIPVQVAGLSADVAAVAAGEAHTVALKNDGTVWTWGSNSNGQLGDDTKEDKSTPVKVKDLSDVTSYCSRQIPYRGIEERRYGLGMGQQQQRPARQ